MAVHSSIPATHSLVSGISVPGMRREVRTCLLAGASVATATSVRTGGTGSQWDGADDGQ